jgi:hypothetical protein
MPSPQYQRNQASLRALKHHCLFDFDFRRELLSRTRLSHKALKMKSSSLLTDGALANWEASLKTRGLPSAIFFSNLHARLPVGSLSGSGIMLRISLRILFGATKPRTFAIPTAQRKNINKSGSERIDMTKFGGKWDRVDLVEHCERDPHSADANVVETLDLVNAACTAWLAKKELLLSWESDPATNPAYFRPAPSRQPIHGFAAATPAPSVRCSQRLSDDLRNRREWALRMLQDRVTEVAAIVTRENGL